MSKIMAVNAGSSSLKFQLLEMTKASEVVLTEGIFEKIGQPEPIFTIKYNGEKDTKLVPEVKNHGDSVEMLLKVLVEKEIVKDLNEIKGVGHRILHCGEKYSDSVIMNEESIAVVESVNDLGPLHNPANLTGVRAFMEALPNTPNVGIFDTAFHQTMAKEQYLYSVPYSWYEDYKIRKYGFHGTSHKFITKSMKEILGKEDINIIVCHIGSGGSLCAVKDGKSFDTTMGFTPNAGIMMGTRSGDIDYTMIPFVMKESGMTFEEVDNALNKQSGLLGVSGYSDSRDVENAVAEGNTAAILANDMYINKIANYIAQYYVELEGNIDAMVLTAGVGENGAAFRKALLEKIACLGVKVNDEVNNTIAAFKSVHSGIITTEDSKFPVYVLPTNEELMIATDTFDIINK